MFVLNTMLASYVSAKKNYHFYTVAELINRHFMPTTWFWFITIEILSKPPYYFPRTENPILNSLENLIYFF